MPVLAVHYLTSPYVFAIFLMLPPTARRSTESLKRWLQKIPPTTRLEFSVPGYLVGVPVNHSLPIEKLCSLPTKLGRIANFSAKSSRDERLSPGRHFYVRNTATAGVESVKWRSIWPGIVRSLGPQTQRKRS